MAPTSAAIIFLSLLALAASIDIDDYSGSGHEEECVVPAYVPSESSIQLALEDDVLLQLQCYLTCISDEELQLSSVSRSIYPAWPYYSLAEEEYCSAFQKLQECQRGCETWNKMSSPTLTVGKCKRQCYSDCEDQCGGSSYCNNAGDQCQTQCDKKNCEFGCHDTIMKNETRAPLAPQSPPQLSKPPGNLHAGIYNSILNQSVPDLANSSAGEDNGPTAFIYRIEDMETSTVTYLGQSDPENPIISLTDYACGDVTVSFAAVNKYGRSSYSHKEPLEVYGDVRKIPNLATNLIATAEEDTRIGFFGHVVLKLSWDAPDNSKYLDYYEVEVIPFHSTECGTHYYSGRLDKRVTNYTVQAINATEIPVMGCLYTIKVNTLNGDESCENCESAVIDGFSTPSFDPQCINLQCSSIWDLNTYTFSFNMTWTIPPHLAAEGVVDEFYISKYRGLTVYSPEIENAMVNKTIYSHIVEGPFEPLSSSPQYELQMGIEWDARSIHRPTISKTCMMDATSPPPGLVVNLTIVSYCLLDDENIELEFSWKRPLEVNGELQHYRACALPYPPEINDDGADHFCTYILASLSSFTWNASFYHYFQMRAYNEYVPGPWSEPIILPPDDTRCLRSQTEILPSSTTRTQAETSMKGVSTSILSSREGVYISSTTPTQSMHMSTSITQSPSTTVNGHSSTVPAPSVEVSEGSTPQYVYGVVAAVGVFMIVILGLLAVGGFICYHYMFQRRKWVLEPEEPYEDSMFTVGPKKMPTKENHSLLAVDEWEVAPSDVIIEECLGEGAFGEVYKGIVKGVITNPKIRPSLKNTICMPVAVKLLKLSARGSERRDFLMEIEMMKKVAEGQNPHVVSLVGCVTIQEPLCLITELVEHGNLLEYLQTSRKSYIQGELNVSENNPYLELGSISALDLISFAYQIASGMEYLSSLGIVHRDLACRNILVGEGKVLKITDFGMSRKIDEVYVQKTRGRMPLKWMAIESIITREFTTASDVWAYGILLWEIGTIGGFPYPSIQNEDLLPLLKRGYRMEKPDNCSPEVYAIMLECWNEETKKRPSFTQLRAKFDAMLLAERKDAYIDLQIDADKPYYKSVPDDSQEFLRVSPMHKRKSKLSVDEQTEEFERSPNHKSNSIPGSPRFPRSPARQSPFSRSPSPGIKSSRPSSTLLSKSEQQPMNQYVDEPSKLLGVKLNVPEGRLLTRHASDGDLKASSLAFSPAIRITVTPDPI